MWLLVHTVGVLLLALVVWALARGLRLGPAARHALWLLVLLKLLIPPLFAWPWPLPVLPPYSPDAVVDPEPTSVFILEEAVPMLAESPPARLENPSPESPQREPGIDPPVIESREVGGSSTVIAVWLLGSLAMVLLQMRRFTLLRRWLAHARPASPRLTALLREQAPLLGARPPRLLVLPGSASPLLSAAGRACLLWPERLEEQLSPEGVRAVLAHELAHLARRDHWISWLILAAGCVWWWHPLFYLIRRQLNRWAELACDARVIAALPDDRRSYAEALLDVCQRQSASAAPPALGVAGRRRDLERRLTMILCDNVPSRLSLRMGVGIAFLGLIVLPAWTLGQVKDTGKKEETKTPAAERKNRPDYAVEDMLIEVAQPVRVITEIAKDQPADRDQKLQAVEAKLQALLKEVQALRTNKGAAKPHTVVKEFTSAMTIPSTKYTTVYVEKRTAGPAEVTLSRTRYNLPAATAQALGKFLQEHVKTPAIETKVDGDTLTITTTPEVQRGIGQFIALIGGKGPPRERIYGIYGNTPLRK